MRKGWFDQFFGGFVLIAIGILFILQQMDIIDISIGSIVSTYWPLLLIYAGIKHLMPSRKEGNSMLLGFIFIAVGGYFQARALNWIYLTPGDFFKFLVPCFLIMAGLVVMFKPQHKGANAKRSPVDRYMEPPEPSELPSLSYITDLPKGESQSSLDQQFEEKFGKSFGNDDADTYHGDNDPKRSSTNHSDDNDKVNKSTFIGDIQMGHEYFELKPTNISQFIGDTVLDLTKAQIPYGKTKINISAFIGDIKIYIPDDMDLGIRINASSFIGDMSILSEAKSGFISNISSTTPYYKEANKKIVINISAFIGDIKVNTVA
ncbi:cell wall-active antibiotics response protein LiaF [Paenibacillus sp. CMAA1364]